MLHFWSESWVGEEELWPKAELEMLAVLWCKLLLLSRVTSAAGQKRSLDFMQTRGMLYAVYFPWGGGRICGGNVRARLCHREAASGTCWSAHSSNPGNHQKEAF